MQVLINKNCRIALANLFVGNCCLLPSNSKLLSLYSVLSRHNVRWLDGLGVWFSLWVREVPGSNPGQAQLFFFINFLPLLYWANVFIIKVIITTLSHSYIGYCLLSTIYVIATWYWHENALERLVFKVYSWRYTLQVLSTCSKTEVFSLVFSRQRQGCCYSLDHQV